MNFSDYADHDAVGIARLIKAKEVSAEEVTETAIHVAERMNPKLNALVMTNFDNARAAAAQKLPDSPVSGAPFYLKDVNQLTSDMPTTFSCPFLMG